MTEPDKGVELFDESVVWMPPEFASAGMDAIREAGEQGSLALDINIPKLSAYFAPTRPGTLCGIQGQTSHGKSLFLHYIEHRYALQLAAEKRDQFIVHVSVEEPIEDMAMLALARYSGQPLGDLLRGKVRDQSGLDSTAIVVAGTPIVYLGESADPAKRRPDAKVLDNGMTLPQILGAVDRIGQKLGKRLASLSIDYLQALPIDRATAQADDYGGQRRLQVRSDVYSLRRAATFFGCTVWVAIQSKQELRGVKYDKMVPMSLIPGMYDGEETAAIAQRLDRYLSLWMPSKSYNVGTSVTMDAGSNGILIVEENDMVVKVLKQRGGLPSGRTFRFKLDFDSGDMHAVDMYG